MNFMDVLVIQDVNLQEAYKMKFLLLLLPVLLFSDVGALTKVVDGDTLHFKTNNKKVKCRIAYIDTPESSNNNKLLKDIKNCKDVSAKDMISAGKSATRAAKRLLNIGSEYSYEVHGKDRYGRSICVVKINKQKTFNEQIILDGYAVPYRKYMNLSELRHYNAILTTARAGKKGLWKDRNEAVECLNSARH